MNICVCVVSTLAKEQRNSVSAACVEKGGMIEIRLDSTEGPVIGSVSISPTGGLDIYKQMSCRIKNAKVYQSLFLL